MHSEHVVHLVGHNGRRSDDNKVQSLEFAYQTVSYSSSFVVQALDHASVDVRNLYTPNHHQVSEPVSDFHQEQEQLL